MILFAKQKPFTCKRKCTNKSVVNYSDGFSKSNCLVGDYNNGTIVGWGAFFAKQPRFVRYPVELLFDTYQSPVNALAATNASFFYTEYAGNELELHSIGDISNCRLGHTSRSASRVPGDIDKNWLPMVYTDGIRTCFTRSNTTLSCFGQFEFYFAKFTGVPFETKTHIFVSFGFCILLIVVFTSCNFRNCKSLPFFIAQMSNILSLAYTCSYMGGSFISVEMVLTGRELLSNTGFVVVCIIGVITFSLGVLSSIVLVVIVIANIWNHKEKFSIAIVLSILLYTFAYSLAAANIALGVARKSYIPAKYAGYQIIGILLCIMIATTLLLLLEYKRAPTRMQKAKDELFVSLLLDNAYELEPCSAISIDARMYQIKFDELSNFVELGAGASGHMLKATWRKKVVAVKLFKTTNSINQAELESLFSNELSLLLSLRHENIVNVYGACLEQHKLGIVMV